MSDIAKLIKLCACKVVFNVPELKYWRIDADCVGRYILWPDSFVSNIEISPTDSKIAKIVALAHETGHAVCATNKCKCFTDIPSALCEYHAIKFATKWLFDNKSKKALKYHIVMVEQEAKRRTSVHTTAYKRIQTLKLWEKVKEFVAS